MKWVCPAPLRDYPTIVMGHGGGGKLSQDLVENLFLPALRSPELEAMGDAGVFTLPPGRVAMSTDSYVVRPILFPGSSIGELAIHGTVNDLAMQGAKPLYLSAGFILEEGLSLETLATIVGRMGDAARACGVRVVTGDTKVVERGAADQLFINTAGVGVIPEGVDLGPHRIAPGDRVIVSGTIGDHGIAIMSVREGLEFNTPIESDCRALHQLAGALLETPAAVKMLRDATRGGLAAVLNEMAKAARVGITIEEKAIPVRPEVRGACEMLGLDPLLVANEGKFAAIVAAGEADNMVEKLRRLPGGEDSRIIGTVHQEQAGLLAVRTLLGTRRIVPLPLGEQLPRIC